MSNVKITDLPSLTGALSDSLDVLPVVDISTDTTSKMTRAEFFQNVPSPAFTGQASFAGGSAAAPSITFTGDTNTGIWSPAADTIAFSEGGAEAMRITSAGDIGLGTNAPTKKLELAGDAKFVTTSGIGLQLHNNSSNQSYLQFTNTVTGETSASGFQVGIDADEEGMIWYYRSEPIKFATNSLERMRIDASGNVSIGGYIPGLGTRLAMYGGIRFLTTETAANTYTGIGSIALDAVSISTSGSERMRIDSSGNVGIGTSTPSKKLEVYAASASLQINSIVRNDTAGAGVAAIGFNVSSSASGESTSTKAGIGLQRNFAFGGGFLCFYNNNSGVAGDFTTADERMRIDGSGNVGIGTTSPVAKLHVTGASITTGVVYKAQPAQTSKAAAATLTIAELLTGIVQYTGAAATLTLPTGTLIEGGLPATFPTDVSFDVSFINTGAALLTIGTATNLTLVGTMTVATLTSAMLRFRKTATNTYTVYRIS